MIKILKDVVDNIFIRCREILKMLYFIYNKSEKR